MPCVRASDWNAASAGLMNFELFPFEGQGSLESLTQNQIENALYSAYAGNVSAFPYSSLFHDVTQGQNFFNAGSTRRNVTGFPAGTGYDYATGLGGPIANTMVTYLAGL